jgi:hypothetical protein
VLSPNEKLSRHFSLNVLNKIGQYWTIPYNIGQILSNSDLKTEMIWNKMVHTCQFCNSDFTTKSYMTYHQKNTRYCLEKQGNTGGKNFTCKHCDKKLSSEKRLKTHYNICDEYNLVHLKNKYEEKLREKDSQLSKYEATIKHLQDKLENIAIKAVQRPTTTNNMNKTQINNIIQKMEPISQNYLVDQAPHLTIEHVQKGASGYAEYALEYPLKDRIACVDYSRRKIKFKDTEGNIVTDPEMVKLAPMFFDSIKNKSSQLVHGMNRPDMDSSMFEQVANLFNTNADVKNGSSGVKTDFYHDFVKHICSGSVVEV